MIDPLNDGISQVAYEMHAGDDLFNVNAARISLDARSEWGHVANDDHDRESTLSARDKKLLRYLIRHGHWSVFHHASLTVRLIAPIFVTRQIFRHTSLSPNEVSGRYVELKEQFYVPKEGEFRKQAASNRQASVEDDGSIDQEAAHTVYANACNFAYEAYRELLKLGVTREQARGVLPQTMYTEFILTGNVRSWLHFFTARIHPGVQLETQKFAEAIKLIFAEHFPETLAAYEEVGKHDR